MAVSRDYLRIHDRVTALAAGLRPEEHSRRVPATPEWDVHDLLAHMCGAAVDIVEGRVEGVATDPWTAAQVEARRGMAVDDILAEWASAAPRLAELIDQLGGEVDPRLFLDVWTHEQDLRGALGTPGGVDDPVVDEFTAYTAKGVARRIAAAGLPAVTIDLGETERPRAADGSASVRIDSFEHLRAVLGRRSRAQIRRWEWTGVNDTDSYAEVWAFFDLPSDDVIDAR